MEENSQKKKVKTAKVIIGVVVVVIGYFVVQELFKNDAGDELRQAAVELNQKAPMQIDRFTRFDSASTKSGTNFIYYYTLVRSEKRDLNVDTLRKNMQSKLIENVKTNPDLKGFRDQNITMDYIYFDKDGELTVKIAVTPDLYKAK